MMANKKAKRSLGDEDGPVSITTTNLAKQVAALIKDDENIKKEIRSCARWDHPFLLVFLGIIIGFVVCYLLLVNYNEVGIKESVSDAIKHETGITIEPR